MRQLFIISLIVTVLLYPACSTNKTSSLKSDLGQNKNTGKISPLPKGAESSNTEQIPENPHIDTTSDNIRDVLSKLEEEKKVQIAENKLRAQKHYETALTLFKEFNYIQSAEEAVNAIKFDSDYEDALTLQKKLKLIVGGKSDEINLVKEFLQKQLSVKIQELETEIRFHFIKGQQLIAEQKYDEAESEFEAVIAKLKWMPYHLSLKDNISLAQEQLDLIQELIVRQKQETEKKMLDAAEQMTRQEEAKKQQEHNEKLKSLVKEALYLYAQGQFEKAERISDTILKSAPNFKLAEEIKKESIRARHYEISEKYIKIRSELFNKTYDAFKEAATPYADDQPVRYEIETWETAEKRIAPGIITSIAEKDPDLLEIKRKLKTIYHDFILNNDKTLYEITEYIQSLYKIPIIYSTETKQDDIPNQLKKISLIGLPLEIGLYNLLDQYNLTYSFDSNAKSLKITKPTELAEDLEWRVYNLDDLARAIPEFPGPNLEASPLTPGGTPDWQPPVPADELPPITPMSSEDLIELIKKNTGKNKKKQSTWENSISGVNIKRIGESNKIIAVHTAEVQSEITEFLRILRSFRNAMISVEATFLSTTNNIMETLGIELRNISGESIPNAPDIPGQSNPSAGLLLGGNRDVRFRTAYTFRDQNSQVENALPETTVGGLGLQFAVLGRPRINMLLSSMEKTGGGFILDSPKITALNGQKVNAAYIKQRRYIQDGEIQAGAIAYEPIINFYSTGVVLEVKPVISYDRKFITLHISPTIVELAGSRETTLEYQADPPGLATSLITEITIEKPWLRIQRCRTSAQVPDEGALILGGLDTIYKQDLTASTPLTDKIPVLAPFFRRKAKSVENTKQFIIVRAKIIELSELEQLLQ